MKKVFAIFIILVLLSFDVCAQPVTSSGACILMDAETGQVLFSKNANERMYPASITKLLTVYIACERLKMADIITVSKTAVDSVPRDTSNIALDYDEKITVEDALSATMLMSANDAANVLAEHVSGSLEEFAKLMNKTANEMGVTNSNFVNANGLHDEAHYTTAQDFALIVKEALKNERFVEFLSMLEYTITATNKKDEVRNLATHHRMMFWPQYAELNVIGGKSGYTSQSLFTLVTYGERDGKKLIAVVLKSQTFTDVYKDTQTLLEYGYNDFTKVTIDGANVEPYVEGRTTVVPKGSVSFLLENEYNENELVYKYSGEVLNICLPKGTIMATLETEKIIEPSIFTKILKTIGIVILVLLLLVLCFIVWYIRVEKDKRRKRDIKKKLLYK